MRKVKKQTEQKIECFQYIFDGTNKTKEIKKNTQNGKLKCSMYVT